MIESLYLLVLAVSSGVVGWALNDWYNARADRTAFDNWFDETYGVLNPYSEMPDYLTCFCEDCTEYRSE